jgi:Fic-DOC domain mobile mystery protein B
MPSRPRKPAKKTGNTPITPDELDGLIPSLATQDELNEWERDNILMARTWALAKREIKKRDTVSEPYVRELHGKMFNQTWKWAGTYRRSEKNFGVPVHEIRERLAQLLGNLRYWIEHQTYDPDEIAVRAHHELVVIHPFANGNGRHARLFADVLALNLGRPEFTWGRHLKISPAQIRAAYLDALRAADRHDFHAILKFARD